MKLTVVGAGYVGLVTATCLAEMGNQVQCADVDDEKIRQLAGGRVPIYEPTLAELVRANQTEGRLDFTTDIKSALEDCRLVMIAVGTPSLADGRADLGALFTVVDLMALHASRGCLLVTKSTAPVGTARQIRDKLTSLGRPDIMVACNPEFLKQGDAVGDFMKPDRVVIGVDDEVADQLLHELYAPFMRTGDRVMVMDVESAELTKYASNAFLATKISFMNDLSRVCEKVGADIELVRLGMSTDKRIGEKFLFPGLGFGGSCFPKDIQALKATAEGIGEPLRLLHEVIQINNSQRIRFCELINQHFGGVLEGRKLAMWGLSFKPKTDDIREAPAITIIDWCLENGIHITAYDPRATERVQVKYGERISYSSSAYGALQDADGLILATEWNEFRRPDFSLMRKIMKSPLIFDGRNLYKPKDVKAQGFQYYSIGRRSVDGTKR